MKPITITGKFFSEDGRLCFDGSLKQDSKLVNMATQAQRKGRRFFASEFAEMLALALEEFKP